MAKLPIGEIITLKRGFHNTDNQLLKYPGNYEVQKYGVNGGYFIQKENSPEVHYITYEGADHHFIRAVEAINRRIEVPNPLTLTLPLFKGVEEFYGYFDDSEGDVWYVKVSKTGKRRGNE